MRSGRIFILLLVLILGAPVSSWAAGNSANVLLKPSSAKPAGMAEAVSSLDVLETGIDVYLYNPAASANLTSPQVSFMNQKGILDDTYSSLFYGHPTPLGTFSLGTAYYSLGDINLINAFNVSRTVNAETDYVVSLNYAEEFLDILGTGLTLKYLNSTLVEAINASAFAFDLGIQARPVKDRLALGFSILNIGPSLKYIDILEPLPLTVRAGGSYRFDFENLSRVLVSLDLVKELGNNLKGFIGEDYVWNDLFSIRSGYKLGQDEGAFSAGLGFMAWGFILDYALTSGRLGQRHFVSLNYRFNRADLSRSTVDQEWKTDSQEIQKLKKSLKKPGVKTAVLGLNSIEIMENSAAVLTDNLFLEFSKVPKVFDLEDPQRVRDYIRQSELDLTQCTEVECLKNVGAALNVQKIVTGLLTFSLGEYFLTVQMLDVETGSIEVPEAAKAANMKDMEYEIRSLVQSLAKSVR